MIAGVTRLSHDNGINTPRLDNLINIAYETSRRGTKDDQSDPVRTDSIFVS